LDALSRANENGLIAGELFFRDCCSRVLDGLSADVVLDHVSGAIETLDGFLS